LHLEPAVLVYRWDSHPGTRVPPHAKQEKAAIARRLKVVAKAACCCSVFSVSINDSMFTERSSDSSLAAGEQAVGVWLQTPHKRTVHCLAAADGERNEKRSVNFNGAFSLG